MSETMSETEWMYDSLTERFGENLGERQRVVDALLIAKAIVGPGPLGGTNSDSLITVTRFILDEWGKCSDDEVTEGSVAPVVLDNNIITLADFDLLKYGTYTLPEGSRWANSYGVKMVFTKGEFLYELSGYSASTYPESFPFTRIEEEN